MVIFKIGMEKVEREREGNKAVEPECRTQVIELDLVWEGRTQRKKMRVSFEVMVESSLWAQWKQIRLVSMRIQV